MHWVSLVDVEEWRLPNTSTDVWLCTFCHVADSDPGASTQCGPCWWGLWRTWRPCTMSWSRPCCPCTRRWTTTTRHRRTGIRQRCVRAVREAPLSGAAVACTMVCCIPVHSSHTLPSRPANTAWIPPFFPVSCPHSVNHTPLAPFLFTQPHDIHKCGSVYWINVAHELHMNYRKGGGTENGDVFVYVLYIQYVCMCTYICTYLQHLSH